MTMFNTCPRCNALSTPAYYDGFYLRNIPLWKCVQQECGYYFTSDITEFVYARRRSINEEYEDLMLRVLREDHK